MLTGATAAAATSSATPRTSEDIAHNKAQAAQKLYTASIVSSLQQRQSLTALHRLTHQTRQLNVNNKNNTPVPHHPAVGARPSLLFTPSQDIPDDAMLGAAASAEAAARAEAAPGQQHANAANFDNIGQPAALPVPEVIRPLPSAFLAMAPTKQHQADAIALYRTHQQSLATARDHLAEFVTKCNRTAPLITLPLSVRAGYTQARFIAVEGDAAFYKPMTDGLKKLAEDSDKAAYTLLIEGKQKYIAHLESLVNTPSFISRAITTYTAFVNRVNEAYAARGSTMVVPLATAVAKFKSVLRKEMDIYDAQQVEAALRAQEQKQQVVAMEIDAEERIVTGAHNGNNIAQIAVQATKTELAKTKKSLDDANRNIADLQEQVNRLHGAATVGRSSTPAAANSRSTSTSQPRSSSDQSKLKRKVDDQKSSNKESTAAAAQPSSKSNSSNYRGGGRPQNQPSKKFKRNTGGNEGGGSDVNPPKGRKGQSAQPAAVQARTTGS